ncbi:MAG: succinylglutamate desuccinylase/aspartoacylase family protein, partial [Burkholderiaceae bacterium]
MPSPDTLNEYPLEIEPPDISRWAPGNTGIPYVWSFAAQAPGPHVMLTAVVHGNELCGAIAIDNLLTAGVRPARGTLSLGFMNVAAFLSYDPVRPNTSRFVDEDFNRLWAEAVLDGPGSSVELIRAREVRPIIHEVDLLLDIHSMQHPAIPLMMAGPVAKGRSLARLVGTPQTIITDAGHPQGKRMR